MILVCLPSTRFLPSTRCRAAPCVHPTPLQMMHAMAETPNQQVTVLSQVLASEVNIGYEEIINMQVCVPRLLAPAAGCWCWVLVLAAAAAAAGGGAGW